VSGPVLDNSQYAELFLTESREHVAAMNHALLILERAAVGPDAADAVSAIFRAVHTVKGMSAMMGYAAVAELSHELETVLDRVRRNDIAIGSTLMDLLFRSADVLEHSVEAAVAGRDGEIIDRELLARIRALGAQSARNDGSASRWNAPAPGTDGLLVRVRLEPDTPLRGVRAFLIVQAVGRAGARVTGTEPSIDALQADGFDADFAMRVEFDGAPPDIERAIRAVGDVADVAIGADMEPAQTTAEFRVPSMADVSDADDADAMMMTTAELPVAGMAPRGQRHVRIDLRRLDTLMNLVGELVIARGRLAQLAGELSDPVLEETVNDASRLITELRDEITASRMVAAGHVFDRFPRIVRDASRTVGKQVELTIEGRHIELDRAVLDEIGDSIVHLLRNAIDHGLESAEDRAKAGKDPVGHLKLSAERDRSAVVIKVSDDGRGIDRVRVLARAKSDGLVEADKNELTEDELLRLLARPGFSTADQITGLSGRGVGVDAVYTRVRALGGAMDIRSVPGQGTTMVLRLPLTLAIVRALLARVENETYSIPLAHVSETVELAPDVLKTVKGREVLLGRDEVLPLLRLRDLVGLPPYRRTSDIDLEQVIVIDLGDRRAGLVIDELTGQEEIVVKQYDAVRDGLPFFGGATLLSDGTPSLIVDVSSLL
jgi:two-component system, chemotaxis family, sensor kinase CheA